MPTATKIMEYRATLDDLCQKLGVKQKAVHDGETTATVVYKTGTADPTTLLALHQNDLDRWFQVFGEGLRIDASTRDDIPPPREWRASVGSHSVANLQGFLRHAIDQDAVVELAFTLFKQQLTNKLKQKMKNSGAPAESTNLVLFFFGARLLQILQQQDYRAFEGAFLGSGNFLLILIADAPGRLRGRYLGILGSDFLDQFQDFLVGKGRWPGLGEVEALRTTWRLMARYCNWAERPSKLTPDFLRTGIGGAGGLRDHRRELIRIQNQLAMAFLANRTDRDESGNLQAHFEWQGTIAVQMNDQRLNLGPYRLFRWAYHPPGTAQTRLSIVRRVLRDCLPRERGQLTDLVRMGSKPLRECRVQERLLIDANLLQSFRERQEVAALVRKHMAEVGEGIRSLARELVDHTYRTVGLVVATVVAAMLKPEQANLLLVSGFCVSALYLLFVRIFYVGAVKRDYGAKEKNFRGEKRRIEASGVVEIGELFRPVEEKRSEFRRRFLWVSVIYLALVLICGAAAVLTWLTATEGRSSPEALRKAALQEQAKRFENFSYTDVRLRLPGHQAPLPLIDEATGKTALADLSAVSREGRLILVTFVPCSLLGDGAFQDKLLDLRRAAEGRADLQLLVPAVCGEGSGPEQLQAWLEVEPELAQARIWVW